MWSQLKPQKLTLIFEFSFLAGKQDEAPHALSNQPVHGVCYPRIGLLIKLNSYKATIVAVPPATFHIESPIRRAIVQKQ